MRGRGKERQEGGEKRWVEQERDDSSEIWRKAEEGAMEAGSINKKFTKANLL